VLCLPSQVKKITPKTLSKQIRLKTPKKRRKSVTKQTCGEEKAENPVSRHKIEA